MLRIYLIHNLYDLSNIAAVAEEVDSRAFSRICGVEPATRSLTVIRRARNLPLKNGLQEKFFVHDTCVTANLLAVKEQVVYGNSGYLGGGKTPEAVTKNTPVSGSITKSTAALPKARAIPHVLRHKLGAESGGNLCAGKN